MIRRSAAVAVAVTIQQLASGKTADWTPDQKLVLDALRRSKETLNHASDADLSEYVKSLRPDQLNGVASNVKGIFHEMLVKRAENMDGDLTTAEIFDATNHPGADIEFIIDGTVIQQVQLKAVQDPASIVEHFACYPDIDVMATSEIYAEVGADYAGRLFDSGFSNIEISKETQETLLDLAGEDISDFIEDGALTSILIAGALQAKATLQGQAIDRTQIRSTLELVGIGMGTAITVETLLNLI
ncbi:hypothetical protein KBW81_03445 [Loktanella salsilacus]|jgi:hypothetical protein|uniref:hypothetical protein n=1 Tax=Loktanella salsilacus TaxID=195913 RepID=UPI0020B696A7|nr:hypothetical protein [Loktanella salsilacus]UTH48868.1 hypothetical protein KBW81_03445 [Loktanella salsilacus]